MLCIFFQYDITWNSFKCLVKVKQANVTNSIFERANHTNQNKVTGVLLILVSNCRMLFYPC